jgi:flagellar hook-basal body complex protein FliE
MDIKGNSLYQEMQAMMGQAQAPSMQNVQPLSGDFPSDAVKGINPSQQNFADMLSSAVNNVNNMQLESRSMQKAFDMGDSSLSLADVMVAKEKSGIAFEATMQVRNKVLEAYKQIMNMPV